MPGLLAQKLGMTQYFYSDGRCVPVTVLKAGPCCVVMKKTVESDGYDAVQLGYREVEPKRKTKAYAGHFLKKNLKVFNNLVEFSTKTPDLYTPGDMLLASCLEAGDHIDVSGISKGKGFQGVMKRHHFAGGFASHGCSVSHRVPGSTGQRTWPGKVIKGKRMPGRMGGERVTQKNLEVVAIEALENLILVRGAVPGANRGLVCIFPKSQDFEKRFKATKEKKETPEKPAEKKDNA